MRAETPAVLFVCTANVCRSPMAAALFYARVSQAIPSGKDWLVDSAGTWGRNGLPASENSVLAMRGRGLDISAHRSKVVTSAQLALFDLILVMEPGHKEALRIEFPELAARVFLLSEMSGPAQPIADPYGSTLDQYEKTAKEIEAYLDAGMPKIIEIAQNPG